MGSVAPLGKLLEGVGFALHRRVRLFLHFVGMGQEAQQAFGGHRVDGIRGADALHPLDGLFVGGEQAEAQSGQAPGFRESAADDEVLLQERQGAVAVVFVISFVQNEDGVGELLEPLFQSLEGECAAGWIVGGSEHGQFGVVEFAFDFVEVGFQVVCYGNFREVSSAESEIVGDEGKGGGVDDGFVAGVQEGEGGYKQAFVAAVGEQEAVCWEVEESGERGLQVGIFRVGEKMSGFYLGEVLGEAYGVFVEVETDFLPSAFEWGDVGVQVLHRGAGLDGHARAFCPSGQAPGWCTAKA